MIALVCGIALGALLFYAGLKAFKVLDACLRVVDDLEECLNDCGYNVVPKGRGR